MKTRHRMSFWRSSLPQFLLACISCLSVACAERRESAETTSESMIYRVPMTQECQADMRSYLSAYPEPIRPMLRFDGEVTFPDSAFMEPESIMKAVYMHCSGSVYSDGFDLSNPNYPELIRRTIERYRQEGMTNIGMRIVEGKVEIWGTDAAWQDFGDFSRE